jgi:hypothetical protein
MKFIRAFESEGITAVLTVDEQMRPTVAWLGKPSKAIVPEYGQWIRESLQIAANVSGKSVLYLAPGTDIEPIMIKPQTG